MVIGSRCIICETARAGENGLVVCGNYICPLCEEKIIRVSVNNPAYEFYTSGLKKIWRCTGNCLPSGDSIFLASLARR